jgi:hypothetical protein
MGNSPKDAASKAEPALDEDLELEQSDTDAVAGGHAASRKSKAKAARAASKAAVTH